MHTEFSEKTKPVADELIAMSRLLDIKMETWRDVIARVPDSTSKNVSAGFITKPAAASGVELVVDIQTPPIEQMARLRIWAIEIIKDSAGSERFNNIQLNYHLNYTQAHQLVQRESTLTRDDLANLLHDPANQLENIVISDQTGKIEASEQLLGKRYDLDAKELESMTRETGDEITQALNTVLVRLKKSAASEAHQ